MLDWVIEGATIVDGTGAPPHTGDVAVEAGRIVAVEERRITSTARQRIDGHGAWLTPGFVDIHTHYDGQASWDETFSPSVHHGVTTVLMGNCGVGFAPLVEGGETTLVELMEGVEDIPGAALAEGVTFAWRSFPDYMAALDAMPHTIDFLAQVPHDPLRLVGLQVDLTPGVAPIKDALGRLWRRAGQIRGYLAPRQQPGHRPHDCRDQHDPEQDHPNHPGPAHTAVTHTAVTHHLPASFSVAGDPLAVRQPEPSSGS